MSKQLLRHAGIGFGEWGKFDADFMEKTGNVIIHAISDEDENNLKVAAECFPKAHFALLMLWPCGRSAAAPFSRSRYASPRRR